MKVLFKLICAIGLAAALMVPSGAFASVLPGFSFGGTVISLPVPCIEIPGSYGFLIKPAGRFAIWYIYTPFLTLGLGPTFIGQQILGIADSLPPLCNGIPGFRVRYDGVSLPI